MNGQPLRARTQMLYYGSGIVLMKGVSLLMLPIITHYLTPSEYGVLDVLLTWLNLLGIVLGFGFTDVLYRFCREPASQQQVIQQLMLLHVQLLLPLLLLGCGVIVLCQPWLPAALQTSLLILTLIVAMLASALIIPLCVLRMRDQADWFFACTAGKALLQALLCWWMLSSGMGLISVLYASLLSHLLLVAWLFPQLNFQCRTWQWGDTQRQFLRYGWPLVLSSLCLFLVCGAERWIIAGVLTAGDLAQYAIASQFALMVAVSIEPFTLWWYPKRLAMLADVGGHARVASTAAIGCLLGMFAAIGIAAVGPWLIHQLLPAAYHEAAGLLPWLCLAMALKQCSHILNTGCYVGEHTHQVGRINAILAVIAPPLYIVGCVSGGLSGLLLMLILLYTIRLVWFYQASQRTLPLPYPTLSLGWGIGSASLWLLLHPMFSAMFAAVSACILLSVGIAQLWLLWRGPTSVLPAEV